MTTYRPGGSWKTTIVREGILPPDEKGRRPDDEFALVVIDADRPRVAREALARQVSDLLSDGTPDRTYLRGVRDALAEVRRRLTYDDGVVYPADAQMLREAAAELGLDEEES